MKFVTIQTNNENHLGVKTDRGILNVTAAARSGKGSSLPVTVHELIEGGAAARQAIESLVREAESDSAAWLNADSVVYGPCVTRPEKLICVGLNYRKHAEETNAKIPEYPILFNKFNNTLTGHGHDVELPITSKEVDYEAELAIVIGRPTKHVSEEEALDYVFGYCVVNDLSARDLQLRTNQWMLGKVCDGFSPLGPELVTADEISDPNNLRISCHVNGEQRQNSNTSDMIFNCKQIISYLSRHLTLKPGDVILTGTPEGVVLGYPPEKRVYLQPGDVVTVSIEKLGSITNKMVAEKV
ncbi:fumarylacetoacetate hydrolase family protein [Paenibacillus hemerocallicola]|uniref:Fumarylacetoacetate hydrolase family protein n=1 Tax=Paenibacillus hemerocallicola TaxID=1172614 RepID=A0A5C4TGT8_9BACL|nr:fumarylacetoacetate hydrolase family protein [Paenibacillus hemerocallicola]TNJ68293.1 fumarylacetoacetate hydrolase family protein [Paenibacillus hemerocallicola]